MSRPHAPVGVVVGLHASIIARSNVNSYTAPYRLLQLGWVLEQVSVYQILPPGRARSRTPNQIELEIFVKWLVIAATVALLSLLAPSASQETNITLPLTYHARAAEGSE